MSETDQVVRIRLLEDQLPVSYGTVLTLWQTSPEFRAQLTSTLQNAPFAAFLWETPPVTADSLDQPFESVLIDCPLLATVGPDRLTFADYFQADADSDGIVCFPNLGHDAQLLVPCPLGPATDYTHLAAFVRQASEPQIHALWRNLGRELETRLSDQPTWMSSNGLGVHWLHLRLDSRPKYYHYSPYRHWPRAMRQK